jgi:hypothetical protein
LPGALQDARNYYEFIAGYSPEIAVRRKAIHWNNKTLIFWQNIKVLTFSKIRFYTGTKPKKQKTCLEPSCVSSKNVGKP